MNFKVYSEKLSTLLAAGALLATGVLSTSQAHANQCAGKVSNVEVFRDGNLMIRLVGPGGVSINRGILCNTRAQIGNTPPEACRLWVSTLQAGVLSGRDVVVWLAGSQTCSVPNTSNLTTLADSVWLP